MRRVRASSGRRVVVVVVVDATAAADTAAGVTVANEEVVIRQHALPPHTCCRVRSQRGLRSPPIDLRALRTAHAAGPFGNWAGLDSNQRRRKASRFTVCPVWPLRYLPVAARGTNRTPNALRRALPASANANCRS